MKKINKSRFSWCPVCMVHTYHKKDHGKWECMDQSHEDFLRFRTDPWIEEYRKSKTSLPIRVPKGV